MSEKITGRVARTNNWSSGSGYFVKLLGDERDFYAFGACPYNVGDVIEVEAELDNTQIRGKWKLLSWGKSKQQAQKPALKETGPELAFDAPSGATWQPGDERDPARLLSKVPIWVKESLDVMGAIVDAANKNENYATLPMPQQEKILLMLFEKAIRPLFYAAGGKP
jgi:hypothetical protein